MVGEHDEFPVENLDLSHCNRFIASCSHDQKVKFWNVDDVKKEKVDIRKKAKKSTQFKTLNKAKAAKNDFFADLAENEPKGDGDKSGSDDEDDDDDSDEDSDDDSDVDNQEK